MAVSAAKHTFFAERGKFDPQKWDPASALLLALKFVATIFCIFFICAIKRKYTQMRIKI